MDESASNERTAERRWGWSVKGKPCRVKRSAKRSKRWSILPALTIDGYMDWEIYQDSFTKVRFNAFIKKILLHMQPSPLPRSVLIMDNHSIHHSEELTEMCVAAGVILLYLPPYSPIFNPIEQSFAQLKSWMRRNHRVADFYAKDFEGFIRLALSNVMVGRNAAAGHFRACGYEPLDLDDDNDDVHEHQESDSEWDHSDSE